MVQSKFNLDAWFSSYDFFLLKKALYMLMLAVYSASVGARENYCWCARLAATASFDAWLLSDARTVATPELR